MIAALYARKSTEQVGADADAKSVARQLENARTFAVAKGWRVHEDHVYHDDATSGAEVKKLVNRQRLLDAISQRPAFDVLIMRDASRFSRRDGDEAFAELKRIAQAGVAIWFYQDGTPFTYGSFGDNVVGFVRAEMNAEFRRSIAKWTTEAMRRKALAGHVTGGRVFGYDNVKVDGHTERQINEAEAAIVRRIFDLCASGTGYTRIAKRLNAERTPAPRAQPARPTGWSPSTVYEVLHRLLYRGVVVWNKTKKRDPQGKTAVTARPEAEWLQVDKPALRIVSEDVWTAAHTRLQGIRSRLGAAQTGGVQRRRRDIESPYLLSGFLRCTRCGGSLSVLSRNAGRDKRAYAYGCLAHAKRGATVCDNALVLPVERVDAAVRDKLARDVLRPAVVRAIIAGVFEALEPATVAVNVSGLQKDLRGVDEKIARLTEAVESGAAVQPLVAKLQQRQAERESLVAAIAAALAVEQVKIDRSVVEQKVLAQVAQWHDLFATNGRQALREVLVGPMHFTPDGQQYRFEGVSVTGQLIAGLIGASTLSGVPNGNRHLPVIPFTRTFRAA